METKTMNFEQALSHLKRQKKSGQSIVTRQAYGSSKASPKVLLQYPDEFSKMTESYLYMEKFQDSKLKRFPLDLSCESILADDWIILQ